MNFDGNHSGGSIASRVIGTSDMQDIELNQVYNGCGVEGMKSIPGKSVDMVFCDLPYNLTNCQWDKLIPFEPLWEQWERICKNNACIVLTGKQPFTTDIINSNRKLFRYELIWEKSNPVGFLNAGRMPLSAHENIIIFYKKMPIYNPQKWVVGEQFIDRRKKFNKAVNNNTTYNEHGQKERKKDDGIRFPLSVIPIPSHWSKAMHPTQKPVALLEWLIKTYTNEGALVLDNCMGSWTTAVACANTNRNFIGFEKDPDIWLAGKNRYEQHIKSLTITNLFTQC